jgi:hypothetical protein
MVEDCYGWRRDRTGLRVIRTSGGNPMQHKLDRDTFLTRESAEQAHRQRRPGHAVCDLVCQLPDKQVSRMKLEE